MKKNEIVVSSSSTLAQSPQPIAPQATQREIDGARDLISAARAKNTQKMYAHHWKHFEKWCEAHRASSLPAHPQSIVMWVREMQEADKALSTINQAVVAVSFRHKTANLPSPTDAIEVKAALAGLRRQNKKAEDQRPPLMPADLKRMVNRLDLAKPVDLRDRALLLVGFRLALRASEPGLLRVKDVRFDEQGNALVNVLRQKTQKRGEADRKLKLISKDSAATVALKFWHSVVSAILPADAPLFPRISQSGVLRSEALSPRTVDEIIQRRAANAGVIPPAAIADPTLEGRAASYGGHSLRSGFVTAMRKAKKSYEDIMKVTDHEDFDTVRRYDRVLGSDPTTADFNLEGI